MRFRILLTSIAFCGKTIIRNICFACSPGRKISGFHVPQALQEHGRRTVIASVTERPDHQDETYSQLPALYTLLSYCLHGYSPARPGIPKTSKNGIPAFGRGLTFPIVPFRCQFIGIAVGQIQRKNIAHILHGLIGTMSHGHNFNIVKPFIGI